MTDDTLIKEWLNALERVSVSELSSIATFCHLTSLSMDAVLQCMYLIGSSMFMYSWYSRVALAIPLFDIVMFDIGSIWIEIIESFCHFVVTLTIWTIRIHRISIWSWDPSWERTRNGNRYREPQWRGSRTGIHRDWNGIRYRNESSYVRDIISFSWYLEIGTSITVYRCRQAMTFTGRRRCPVNRPIFHLLIDW